MNPVGTGAMMSGSGPSSHFAATQQFGRFAIEADIKQNAATEAGL
jgi:hypothetical protein